MPASQLHLKDDVKDIGLLLNYILKKKLRTWVCLSIMYGTKNKIGDMCLLLNYILKVKLRTCACLSTTF